MTHPYDPMSKLRDLAAQSGIPSSEATDEYLLSKAFADKLDSIDTLARFRDEFHLPCKDLMTDPAQTSGAVTTECVYLCGNSLGLQPKRVERYLLEELTKWRVCGVEGHFNGARPWARIDEFATTHCANIVGASSDQDVVVMNSLSVNLHLLLLSFYRPTTERKKIFIEHGAFCSDYHVVKSQIEFHGGNPDELLITLAPREGERFLRTEDIVAKIDAEGDSIALVLFPGVQFYTGQAFNISAITAAAQKKGCYAGFDLAHAVGNIPLRLDEWGVDFAAWCSYKYLNAGPGAIAGAFVHPKHKNKTSKEMPRLAGWWGQELKDRFSMGDSWVGKAGAQGWQLSNPSVVSVVSMQAAVEVMCEAGLPQLRQKSERLTAYLEAISAVITGVRSVEDKTSETNVKGEITQLTPRDPAQRGCQLSLLFPYNVTRLNEALIEEGVVCDVRKPDVLRVAPTPLYNSFNDVFSFVQILNQTVKKILEEQVNDQQ